jgi:hypothetical protein
MRLTQLRTRDEAPENEIKFATQEPTRVFHVGNRPVGDCKQPAWAIRQLRSRAASIDEAFE